MNSCDDCIDDRKRTTFLKTKVSMTKEIISGIGPAEATPSFGLIPCQATNPLCPFLPAEINPFLLVG